MHQNTWWTPGWHRTDADGIRLSLVVPVYNERSLVAEALRRLVDLSLPEVAEIEIIVVDDGSTDGSAEIAREMADRHSDRVQFLSHTENFGKGAALRTGIERASGDLVGFQDADLEYDPRELARLVRPFLEDGADVVYGSRFLSGDRRRVLYFRHALGNRLLTFLSNLFSDLNLTDVETCYKVFRGPLLKSIPIRSNDFAVEIELTAKIAKRNAIVFEVPISYRGRTYREGKKIGWRDGLKAIATVFRYWLIDDLYRQDEIGGKILHNLERARRFNGWMADTIRPLIGSRVLEIGAGIGNITSLLLPRDLYVASDINPDYLHYLSNFSAGKPYLQVEAVDLEDAAAFERLHESFDSVICLNVLEHVSDPVAALRNVYRALVPDGRLILYVPRGPRLYGTLDQMLQHRCRYEGSALREELEAVGFQAESVRMFNRCSVPAWWWNGKILRRSSLSRLQLKIFDLLVPFLRHIDRFFPWGGLGIVAVARKPSGSDLEADS